MKPGASREIVAVPVLLARATRVTPAPIRAKQPAVLVTGIKVPEEFAAGGVFTAAAVEQSDVVLPARSNDQMATLFGETSNTNIYALWGDR